MDQLWAPWRLSYVTAPKPPKTEDACFVCRAVESSEDRKNLLVHRGEHSIVLLNRFPYNNGHLLICPRRHEGTLEQLTQDELIDNVNTLRALMRALTALMSPEGFNVGLNLGAAAGAGLPGHLHWHVVPRWNGDTNFMPVLTETKVIVQSLDVLYERLTEQLRNGDEES